MDLKLTEEQELLREAVRSMCERHSPIEIVRSLEGDEKGLQRRPLVGDRAIWVCST